MSGESNEKECIITIKSPCDESHCNNNNNNNNNSSGNSSRSADESSGNIGCDNAKIDDADLDDVDDDECKSPKEQPKQLQQQQQNENHHHHNNEDLDENSNGSSSFRENKQNNNNNNPVELYRRLEILKEIKIKTANLQRLKSKLVQEVDAIESETKCLETFKNELELLVQEKLAHLEELKQIHNDITTVKIVSFF